MASKLEEVYDKREDTRPNEINVNPLTRGRRTLLFIADLFINFIIAYFLMNIAVVPLTELAMGYSKYTDEMVERNEDIADILAHYGLLYYENESAKTYLDVSQEYTYEQFIRYYVTGEGNEFDIFYNYYIDVRDDNVTAYLDVYRDSIYFIVDENSSDIHDMVSLEPDYQETLMQLYRVGDTPSSYAETLYEDIEDDFFDLAFTDMLDDIVANDLWLDGISYNMIDARLEELVAKCDTVITVATYIAYFLTAIIYYLVIPVCTKHGKTIGMMAMHVERVGINNIFLLRKGEVAVNSIYAMISNILLIMFLPYPTVTFNYLFGLANGQFVILSIIGLVVILAGLIFLLTTQFNQTMFDKLSRTVYISNDDLDEIYKAKGYKI